MTKFFKKSKKPYFGAILGTFNLGQKEISRKKELCQVLNIPIIYHLSKNQNKTNEPFLRKMSNWRMDRQTTVIL